MEVMVGDTEDMGTGAMDLNLDTGRNKFSGALLEPLHRQLLESFEFYETLTSINIAV